jgi:hypothetical protein
VAEQHLDDADISILFQQVCPAASAAAWTARLN